MTDTTIGACSPPRADSNIQNEVLFEILFELQDGVYHRISKGVQSATIPYCTEEVGVSIDADRLYNETMDDLGYGSGANLIPIRLSEVQLLLERGDATLATGYSYDPKSYDKTIINTATGKVVFPCWYYPIELSNSEEVPITKKACEGTDPWVTSVQSILSYVIVDRYGKFYRISSDESSASLPYSVEPVTISFNLDALYPDIIDSPEDGDITITKQILYGDVFPMLSDGSASLPDGYSFTLNQNVISNSSGNPIHPCWLVDVAVDGTNGGTNGGTGGGTGGTGGGTGGTGNSTYWGLVNIELCVLPETTEYLETVLEEISYEFDDEQELFVRIDKDLDITLPLCTEELNLKFNTSICRAAEVLSSFEKNYIIVLEELCELIYTGQIKLPDNYTSEKNNSKVIINNAENELIFPCISTISESSTIYGTLGTRGTDTIASTSGSFGSSYIAGLSSDCLNPPMCPTSAKVPVYEVPSCSNTKKKKNGEEVDPTEPVSQSDKKCEKCLVKKERDPETKNPFKPIYAKPAYIANNIKETRGYAQTDPKTKEIAGLGDS